MNQFRFNSFATALVAGAGLAFLTLPVTMTTAQAQSTTKQCSTQYQAAKEAGTLNGQKWPQFLSECSAKLKGDDDAEATAPAKKATKKEAKETPAKPKKTETAAASKSGMSGKAVTKECSSQYQAAKEAGTLNGQKWPQFLSECSASLKADNSDDATPDEPVAAPKKTTASKPAKTQTVAKTTSADGKPLSPAQIAFRARISECGDQWQQAKASNRTGGKTWPQYWSACNTRLKSE
ncbi:hypothetical protein [Phyllobacterium sp. YR531]|uniref:hypothetical protein n=1 Tax=Phyllobacterium sp. YR531 TaxID=1144343 RepID=UPI00026F6C33|nr:hypothetical protein [Phyllobacterium sp. YR531]EJN06247.1 hypothetical protein PMI41_00310 [Phyllobacterium sp. YR531]